MNREQLKKAVQQSTDAGICVIPPVQDGSKRPDITSWKKYQSEKPSMRVVAGWYSGDSRTGIGWVTGKVSGNLEVLDFDDRTTYEEFRKAAKAVGIGGLVERIESGYLEHSPNGAHWMYRCEEIAGNTKLASRRDGEGVKALIETRGEGGYIIVAPTWGSVNKGGPYKLIRGSIAQIPTITSSERRQLFDLARSFDKMPSEVERVPTSLGEAGRPGDDYAAKTPWAELLGQHGWKRQYSRGTVDYWRRPGKSRGVSATTGHAGTDYMHVFSTSTELPANKSMGKFSVYARLNHGGDYVAASQELRINGFGGDDNVPEVDISGLMASMGKSEVVELDEPSPSDPMSEFLTCPGLIGDMSRFIDETSHKLQPRLALAASIAAVATVIGRKVMLKSGLRPNIYILSVGETGCGKERGRQAIRQAFTEAGIARMCGYDDIASDAGIVTALESTPSCLFMLDEFGRVLKALGGDNAPQHLAAQITTYLRLYGASETAFYGKAYADKKQSKTVDQPSLNILGTTVPGRLHDAMTSEQVSDGLLSRFIVFESDEPDPPYSPVDAVEPPEQIVSQFVAWKEKSASLISEVFASPSVVRESSSTVFDDMESDLRKIRQKMRRNNEDPGLYTRTGTTARKLALIRACGVSCDAPEITDSDATWGAGLAMHLTKALALSVKDRVSDNITEQLLKRVARIIRDGGKKGVNRRVLTRRTQSMTRQQRQDCIITLGESGQIKKSTNDSGATTYFIC